MAVMSESDELSAAEALRLLGEVRFGRVVFTSRAMPSVRPVRHVLAGNQIVISIGPELVLGPPVPGGQTVVAYEADQIDATGRAGWSVVVIGRARPVTEEAEQRSLRSLLAAGGRAERLVAISTDVVTGFRLAPGPGEPVAARS